MTGKQLFVEYLGELIRCGKTERTIQWSFSDTWDSQGRRLCVWCSTPLPKGKQRQRWCSKRCVDDYLTLKGDMGQIRLKLKEITKEVCQECHTDLRMLRNLLCLDMQEFTPRITSKMVHNIWKRWSGWFGVKKAAVWDKAHDILMCDDMVQEHALARIDMRQLLEQLHRRSLWQADHILAVEEGGVGSDISNFQLLCVKCHLGKTNEAKAKKKAKKVSTP